MATDNHGRKPTIEDFDAWIAAVYDHADEIDAGQEIDWNDMARGWLMARGVDHGYIAHNESNSGWELLSSFTCGDRKRCLRAIAERDAMTEPYRPAPDDDEDEDNNEHEHAPDCSGDCDVMPDGTPACNTPIDEV